MIKDLKEFRALRVLTLSKYKEKLPDLAVWPCLSEFTCKKLYSPGKFFETPLNSVSKLTKIDIGLMGPTNLDEIFGYVDKAQNLLAHFECMAWEYIEKVNSAKDGLPFYPFDNWNLLGSQIFYLSACETFFSSKATN